MAIEVSISLGFCAILHELLFGGHEARKIELLVVYAFQSDLTPSNL